ncbi:MAG: hypothetical protein U1U88_001310 [Lawsonella clevelandensis]
MSWSHPPHRLGPPWPGSFRSSYARPHLVRHAPGRPAGRRLPTFPVDSRYGAGDRHRPLQTTLLFTRSDMAPFTLRLSEFGDVDVSLKHNNKRPRGVWAQFQWVQMNTYPDGLGWSEDSPQRDVKKATRMARRSSRSSRATG